MFIDWAGNYKLPREGCNTLINSQFFSFSFNDDEACDNHDWLPAVLFVGRRVPHYITYTRLQLAAARWII